MKEQSPILAAPELIDVIDEIRKLRNDLIKDFLDERNLLPYLSEQFRVLELPTIKREFIKRDLMDLLISPVNVQLYNPIIENYKICDTASLADGSEKLFYKEIEGVLKRYIY